MHLKRYALYSKQREQASAKCHSARQASPRGGLLKFVSGSLAGSRSSCRAGDSGGIINLA